MASADQNAGQHIRLWRLFSVFLTTLLAMLLSKPSLAQTTFSGGLRGVVTDSSNALVFDAEVVVIDNAKSTHQTMKTDREGVYQFFFLAPARYMLTVSHPGFRTENRSVTVLLGPPVSVNRKRDHFIDRDSLMQY